MRGDILGRRQGEGHGPAPARRHTRRSVVAASGCRTRRRRAYRGRVGVGVVEPRFGARRIPDPNRDGWGMAATLRAAKAHADPAANSDANPQPDADTNAASHADTHADTDAHTSTNADTHPGIRPGTDGHAGPGSDGAPLAATARRRRPHTRLATRRPSVGGGVSSGGGACARSAGSERHRRRRALGYAKPVGPGHGGAAHHPGPARDDAVGDGANAALSRATYPLTEPARIPRTK